MQVLLGGGRQYFYTTEQADPEYPQETGERTDGVNLVQVSVLMVLTKYR